MTEDAIVARLAELEQDNARLRRLLDDKNAPGELRHRLRSTLALMRAIIRNSTKSKEDVEAYAAHLDDRLDAIARVQIAADEQGEVGLAGILAGELHRYGASEGEQVSLAGPDILLQPRAAQVFALAIHELAVNALEHGPLIARQGRIEITWQVSEAEPDPQVSLLWKERGGTAMPSAARQGFGTKILTEMMRYELQADTALDFEADGLLCSIAFDLRPQIGRIAAGDDR